MTWLLPVLAMVVIALVAGLLTGRIGGAGLGEPETSLPPRGLPAGEVDAAATRTVRFNAALRGYRMAEVDETLERLAAELERRDVELAALRGPGGAPVDEATAAPGPGETASATPAEGDVGRGVGSDVGREVDGDGDGATVVRVVDHPPAPPSPYDGIRLRPYGAGASSYPTPGATGDQG